MKKLCILTVIAAQAAGCGNKGSQTENNHEAATAESVSFLSNSGMDAIRKGTTKGIM